MKLPYPPQKIKPLALFIAHSPKNNCILIDTQKIIKDKQKEKKYIER